MNWGYRSSQPTASGVLSRIDARAEELMADPNFAGNALLTAFNEACADAPCPSPLYDLLSRTRNRLIREGMTKSKGKPDPYDIPDSWLKDKFADSIFTKRKTRKK